MISIPTSAKNVRMPKNTKGSRNGAHHPFVACRSQRKLAIGVVRIKGKVIAKTRNTTPISTSILSPGFISINSIVANYVYISIAKLEPRQLLTVLWCIAYVRIQSI